MSAFLDWLDQRAGFRQLAQVVLQNRIPGGARWRYVWGRTLIFTFVVQIITGIALWLAYSPSSQTAWESVYYIQNQMSGGWLLRGLHHYTAQAMNLLLVLHLMQVVIDGAYKAPRELNFWIGLLMLFVVMALSLTGYLLPWDQRGYWATKVATSIVAVTPFAGPSLQKLLLGGAEPGHHTLTHFFAFHAGLLPGCLILLIVAHVWLFRRQGTTVRQPVRSPDAAYWPDQALRNAVAALAVLAAILALVIVRRGAELGPPADPTENFAAARPEWYFLFLFQLLKYFPGGLEVVGAMVIPGLIAAVFFLMPFIARWKRGHAFNVAFLFGVMAGGGLLTYFSVAEDAANPAYRASVAQSRQEAERITVLAQAQGIPAEGAGQLLRQDALTEGPKLFARYCASCHRYGGTDSAGKVPSEAATASDLKGFGSREWLRGLHDSDKIDSPAYFGGTKWRTGRMVKFVKEKVADFSTQEKADLQKVLAAVSADAGLKSQRALDAASAAEIKAGGDLLRDSMQCADCHQFHTKDDNASGPDLTGWASREWMIALVSNPKSLRFYGALNDRMPAFGEDKKLDPESIALIVDWLRGEWYESPARR